MMSMSKSIAAPVVFVLGASVAHAQGTATGTFTVNGKPACARIKRRRGPRGGSGAVGRMPRPEEA
jgi:hypothetical protein